MSRIQGRDTRPEIRARKALHAMGFRYRLHVKDLPGKPDLVFPAAKAVLFVHGCFWHGHDCHLFKWPKSRPKFWRNKISGNVARDAAHVVNLTAAGWRVGTVWECALKGKTRLDSSRAIKSCSTWLRSNRKRFELSGA